MSSKTVLTFYLLVISINVCLSLSIKPTKEEPILTENENKITENGYFFKYTASDGTQREETGEVVKRGDKEVLVVTGFYAYIGDDGQEYYTEYESDENGYRSELRVEEPSVGIPGSVLASLAGGGLG